MAIKYDSQKRAVAKYNATNYDTIQIRVPKGEREGIKAFAESQGETLNGFITKLIRRAMQTEGKQDQ